MKSVICRRLSAAAILLSSVALGVIANGSDSAANAQGSNRAIAAQSRSQNARTRQEDGRRCDALAKLRIDGARIQTAELVTSGIFRTPGADSSASLRGASDAKNGVITDLPPLCRVAGFIDREIKFEVWLPLENWNGRYHGVGIGGFAGSITYVGSHQSLPGLAQAVKLGYAVSATDTGHQTDPADAAGGLWAINHPERLENYFTGGIHKTALASKQIVAAFYGRKHEIATFAGCSGGGRQALVEATKFPEDYDAVVAFAPTDLQFAWGFLMRASIASHRDPNAILGRDQIKWTWDALMKRCDGNDGLIDGSIGDPRRCGFRPAEMLCKPGQSTRCLTAAQIAGLEDYYRPLRDTRGGTRFVSPGETYFAGQAPGTGPYERLHGGPEPVLFEQGWSHLFFQNPKWDWRTFNLAQVEKVVAEYGPRSSWTRDFEAFRKRGGKLIFVQGWADWGITPETTITFYQEMLQKELGAGSGDTPSSFMRLFMAPDTDHCMPGPLGLEFDAVTAVDRWRTTGMPPQRIIATRPLPLPDGRKRTRPLCAFPEEPVYRGRGDTEEAGSFECRKRVS